MPDFLLEFVFSFVRLGATKEKLEARIGSIEFVFFVHL